jgi:DNA-binding IscR family transcriptional regulator
VVELLRKAIEWQTLLEAGQIANQADIARREGITRARVNQVMAMLRLAPAIQEEILFMPAVARRPSVSERILRSINTITDHRVQLLEFQKVLV